MMQIKFDHTTSVVVVSVVFTRFIISEDLFVLNILKSIGRNQLVDSLSCV